MRLIRAPREMNAKAVIETGASIETAETLVMIANTAAVMQRTCGTPENVLAGNQWSTERENVTGREIVKEIGTERGKETMYTEKMIHQCRTREVTEGDMEEKRGGVRAGTIRVPREWEEEGDVHWTMLRKVKKWICNVRL